jgi:hypothetical protein
MVLGSLKFGTRPNSCLISEMAVCDCARPSAVVALKSISNFASTNDIEKGRDQEDKRKEESGGTVIPSDGVP